MPVILTLAAAITLLLWCHASQSKAYSLETDSVPDKGRFYRREVDSIIKHIENTYIFGRRGISDAEWDRRVKLIYDKVDNAQSYRKFRYAERYVGMLIEDAHFDFPNNDGIYSRARAILKEDTICPIRVRTWTDGSVYLVADYTGRILQDAQILNVNGHSAKEMALLNRACGASEERRIMEVMNAWFEQKPFYWLNFTNFMFMESITYPYLIEYIDPRTHQKDTATIQGMTRENVEKEWENYVSVQQKANRQAPKEKDKEKKYYWRPIGYRNVGDGVGVLSIDSFWGSSQLSMLIFGTDNRYANSLKKAMRRIARDNIDKLIIDISGNGGGMEENIYKTLNYFTDKSVDMNYCYQLTDQNRNLIKIITKNFDRKIMGLSKEEHERLVQFTDSIKPNTLFCSDTLFDLHYTPNQPKYRFRGDVYLLTSAWTYSAAQIFAQHFKALGIGTTAGRPCGGYSSISSGNGDMIKLPYWTTYMGPFRPPFGKIGRKDRVERFDYDPVDIFIDRPFEDWMKNENHTLDRLVEIIKQGKNK